MTVDLTDRLWMSPDELAPLLNLTGRAVRNACASGDIPAVRIGARWRIPVAKVRELAGLPATNSAA
ncbi:helix-turn-helix domain-containing protein [Nakamurella leprariae]|uniref:Helix-turn-helix domain-containing protein n=1 Tax=Nakamurella leprariae TaxID=2803911 RepID=A0A938YA98_9ACTN|nr:helix-turn-helix domain-containing protein [Nakamurella leprariae]MBM9466084.1 helix-turn-helix domain-containing protein [Nakamurella leprariae]